MTSRTQLKKATQAIQAIHEAGALLVFPIDNRPEPASIWSCFYPKSEMRWEWDSDGDNRVADLWHLKTELSTTGKVVYTKWYRGRATYFSKPLFTALLKSLNPHLDDVTRNQATLSSSARKLLSILQSESPLSTKELKRLSGLKGRENERDYEKALKELWSRLLIVAYGEVDDGAFPSLAVGATEVLFESIWNDALQLRIPDANQRIEKTLDRSNLFYKFFKKLETQEKKTPHLAPSKSQRVTRKSLSIVKFEDL
jgi:hypothetical protein